MAPLFLTTGLKVQRFWVQGFNGFWLNSTAFIADWMLQLSSVFRYHIGLAPAVV